MKRYAASILAGAAGCLLMGLPASAQSERLSQADSSLSDTSSVIDQKQAPESFSRLAKRLMPAVVNITTSQTVAPEGLPEFPDGSPLERFNEFFGRDPEGFRREGSLGSGFVISADGTVITNNHVIEDADEINVVFNSGRTLKAELVGTDPETDVAVLKVTSDDPLPFVDFADSDAAEVGDWVMAIGNPFGFGGSVSAGIISARNRDIQSGRYDDFIQTDAAINRGNSGGPLFNLNGEVIGVNTAIISPTGGSVGLGFSIPSNLVSSVAGQILEYGHPRRGWFGVNVQGIDQGIADAYGVKEPKGVIITSIDDGGPAAKADFEVGDLVLSFDGKMVENVRGLSRVVAETEIGSEVSVDIVRDRKRRTVSFTVGELESNTAEEAREPLPENALAQNPIGAELREIDDDARRRYGIARDVAGVLVNSVAANGPSFGKLRKGDVITEMAFERISSLEDAYEILGPDSTPPGENLLIRVWRGGQTMFFTIETKR
ncbi:Do family serine endopeptidase [Henriciella mobilis]|uniref:Do family serine endopeptidase n=1 Tax=Henriciella mobilis TaxID=2305467 RepID=A0A399RLI5_9PROT|nr:Do family serine endopeptidase [Henriciella mobilis]RIJ16092.1 Do family serine endopeptidase [Henriciella mobilis]RIJ22996.1 Do family serine endopeptidase [Henriciella mobilis]RIJ32536.1 Do family serine endopeptidase [Henriciella mobilis]